MMSGSTCVFVKDMPVDSLDEDSYDKLESIVGDVPDYCTLIFYVGKADSLKKTAKAKRRSRFYEVRQRGRAEQKDRL